VADDFTYNLTDVFINFPFSPDFESNPDLEAAGQAYHDHRAALMVARGEGLTKTYNRFHDPRETGADILRLRELHDAMDHAVLRAYGWDDLARTARPAFLDESNEDDHKYQGRYFWPADIRDDVLARLLALNAQRAAEDRALGLTPRGRGRRNGDDEGDALEEL
jgi:hypothetical protein